MVGCVVVFVLLFGLVVVGGVVLVGMLVVVLPVPVVPPGTLPVLPGRLPPPVGVVVVPPLLWLRAGCSISPAAATVVITLT
jgi:hypothetical protein